MCPTGPDSKERHLLERLNNVWNAMSLSMANRHTRVLSLFSLFDEAKKDILQGVLSTDEESLAKLMSFVDQRMCQVNDMLSALHLEPFSKDDTLGLLQLSTVLDKKFDELKKIKDDRLSRLQKLKEQRDDYCSIMGEEPKKLELQTNIPSHQELDHLQTYVSELCSERKRRFNEMLPIKKSVEELMRELDMKATSSFDQSIMGDDKDFVISTSNIKKLAQLQSEFEAKKEENIKKKKDMFDRLDYLFSRLDISFREQQAIAVRYPGVSDEMLATLKEKDLAKYEALRRERMAEFIEKLIPEVKQVWEELCLSEEETDSIYKSIQERHPDESEELLEAWEHEMKRCQEYKESNQHVFEALLTWRTAWETFERIERDEKDPDRYKSRKFVSTNIMKEQQQKKQSEKTILKMERLLKSLNDEFLLSGTPFTIYGIPLNEYVEAKRIDYDAAKENERMAKKNEKMKQTMLDATGLRKAQARGGNFVPRGTPSTPSKRTAMASSSREDLSPTKLVKKATAKSTPLLTKPLVRQNTVMSGPRGNMPRCPSQMSVLSVNEDEFRVS